MDQIQLKIETGLTAMKAMDPKTCDRCGGPMRLVGTEPHPVYAETDLFTYACTECDGIQVVSVPIKPAA
jgi:hypothetical protein